MVGSGIASPPHVVRILIVKLSAIGDVVHTLPALTTLRRHRPDAAIDWLAEEAGAEILEGHPALTRRLLLPRRAWRGIRREQGWGAAAKAWFRFAREFRRERYDLVIDFQGLAKSAVWVGLARAARKVGFGRGTFRNEGAWLVLDERIPAGSPDRHALDRGLDLLEAIGFARLPLRYDLVPDPATALQAEQLLVEAGVDPSRPFVAINPVTRWPTKDWEATRFAAVADGLHRAGLQVVLTGGAGDRLEVDAILAGMARPAGRLEGRTTLRSLAAVLQRAWAVLSTDTGPMHLAVAVGTPVVALFGPTAPWRTGPYGPGNRVLRVGLDCSPCFEKRCQTRRYESRACMLRLDPSTVVDAVVDAVAGRKAGAGGAVGPPVQAGS